MSLRWQGSRWDRGPQARYIAFGVPGRPRLSIPEDDPRGRGAHPVWGVRPQGPKAVGMIVSRASCPRVSKASRLRIEGQRPSARAGETPATQPIAELRSGPLKLPPIPCYPEGAVSEPGPTIRPPRDLAGALGGRMIGVGTPENAVSGAGQVGMAPSDRHTHRIWRSDAHCTARRHRHRSQPSAGQGTAKWL